jgi:hypothetical protein
MSGNLPPFTPDPATIYLTDNGRALCGDHLGVTAKSTGRDLSGQPIMPCTPDVVRDSLYSEEWWPCCETCGRRAVLVGGQI